MEPLITGGNTAKAFSSYLVSAVKLETLEEITSLLGQELTNSQRTMTDIKAMFDSISTRTEAVENDLRHDDLSQFLEADVPKLIMPDMEESTLDVNLDDVIATMKCYAEDLKRNITPSQSEEHKSRRDISSLNLEQYATSLDLLGKRLANIKINNTDANNRNIELEAKLAQLCKDVNMFTQVVEAKTTLSERNTNWVESQQDNSALYYDDIINKLLAGINEVTYLLQNKN